MKSTEMCPAEVPEAKEEMKKFILLHTFAKNKETPKDPIKRPNLSSSTHAFSSND